MYNYDDILDGNFLTPLIEAVENKISKDAGFLRHEGAKILKILNNTPALNQVDFTKYLAESGANFASETQGVINRQFFSDFFKFPDEVSCNFFNLNTSTTLKEFTKSEDIIFFIGELFKRGYSKSLDAIKEEFWLLNKINIFSDEFTFENKKTPIRNFWLNNLSQNLTSIGQYADICYTTIDRLVIDLMDIETKGVSKFNYENISKIISSTKDILTEETKEYLIACSLIDTENKKLLKVLLNEFEYCSKDKNSTKKYSPKHYPIWTYSFEHKNPKIHEEFITNGISPYDYSEKTNELYVKILLDRFSKNEEILTELNINKKTLKFQLFNNSNKVKNYTNYDLYSISGNSRLYNYYAVTIDDYKVAYPNLDINEISTINYVVDKTILKETSLKGITEQDDMLPDSKLNYIRQINNSTSLNEPDPLISLHLKMLNERNDSSYSEKYSQILEQLLMTYSFATIEINSSYSKLIDDMLTNILNSTSDRMVFISKIAETIDDPKRQYIKEFSSEYHKHICSEIQTLKLELELDVKNSSNKKMKI